ncbi:hypothetical protein [Vibrio gallaecicus]|uniref:hypothetical protein n=2 Tax=Vibrio gallaecicus TaxID=552386 RepID=UPI0025B2FD29|nr:hypothetical protein [Vibrio gallaecicus]MDN3617206.1 hypothetical protein [Vibrio gallaecicus]
MEPAADKLYRVSQMIASIVPAGSNILQALLTAPYEKRLEKWCVEVTDAVNTLVTQKGFSIEEIQSNEQFIDFLLSLSQTAVKTSQKEKLEYLKSVLINATVVVFDDQEEYNYYLALLDGFSVAHIVVLMTYSGINAGCKDKYERLKEIPNYEDKSYIYRLVLSELISKERSDARSDPTWGKQVYRSPVGNKLVEMLSH